MLNESYVFTENQTSIVMERFARYELFVLTTVKSVECVVVLPTIGISFLNQGFFYFFQSDAETVAQIGQESSIRISVMLHSQRGFVHVVWVHIYRKVMCFLQLIMVSNDIKIIYVISWLHWIQYLHDARYFVQFIRVGYLGVSGSPNN